MSVRGWKNTDVDFAVQAAQAPELVAISSLGPGTSLDEAEQFIARQQGRAMDGSGLSAAIVDEAGGAARVVGYIGASDIEPHHHRASLGYWLLPDARGQRFISHAAALFVPWLWEALALTRLEAVIQPSNAASIRVVQALGFEFEGTLRRYYAFDGVAEDMGMYSLTTPPADQAA